MNYKNSRVWHPLKKFYEYSFNFYNEKIMFGIISIRKGSVAGKTRCITGKFIMQLHLRPRTQLKMLKTVSQCIHFRVILFTPLFK